MNKLYSSTYIQFIGRNTTSLAIISVCVVVVAFALVERFATPAQKAFIYAPWPF